MEAVTIRPRDAYFAKSCPQAVQLDVLRPCEPLPASPFLQKLIRAGHEYEDETFADLFDGVAGAVVIDAEDPDAREWHTTQAAAQGARLIAGGRLPVDLDAHRVGEPDLLVRHGDGYLPVDVKSHKSLERPKKEGTGTALVSDVTTPFLEAAEPDAEHNPRKRVDDLLQLAHYRRLLEAAGLAPSASAGNVAGIYGSEGVVVWYDLDEAWLDSPEHVPTAPPGPLSAMARYDLEFALRLDVVGAAEAHVDDESATLLAEPIVCTQCELCRWREWCGDRLDEVADLSLLSGVDVTRRRRFKALGIDDLHALAALDWTTAELVRRQVDLPDLRAKAGALPAATPLCDVIAKRTKQLDDLAALGFTTVGDLAALDGRTLDVAAAAGASGLATLIDLARARVGPAAAYRRRGIERLDVPRGDVEVDVDMESTNDGCYLWGALVVDRRVPAVTGPLRLVRQLGRRPRGRRAGRLRGLLVLVQRRARPGRTPRARRSAPTATAAGPSRGR